MIKKILRYRSYLLTIFISVIIGAFLAGNDPDFTRALATWLTMTFAAIGLDIAINKYGFDLEEKSNKTLRHLSTHSKISTATNNNGEVFQYNSFVVELKNYSDLNARIVVPETLDSNILFKRNSNDRNYSVLWDGSSKKIFDQNQEHFLVGSKKSKKFIFTQGSEQILKLKYYLGINKENVRPLNISLEETK